MATATIPVYFKFPNGKAFSLEHFPQDTIEKVSNSVAISEGIPEGRIRLKYQGKTLDNNKTIGYLGVCAETILKVEIIVPKDWTIFATFPDGRCEPVTALNVDTLRTLKQRIAAHDPDLTPFVQVLQFQGQRKQITGDNKSLMDVGLYDEAVLDVTKQVTKNEKTNTLEEEEEVDEEKKQEILNTFDSNGKNVEVVFCFDTTGSMYSCLEQVRQKLRDTCSRLLRDIPGMRIGIMANGDYCDFEKYCVRYQDLTTDVDALVSFARDVPSTGGGGNGGECYEWALRKAQQLDWSEDSAKALVMIGDELPHPPSYTDQRLFWKDELDVLSGMGVKVYSVQAYERHDNRLFYEEMAERTNGYYLKLKNFNLITDMFLAVCYRESDQGQLDAFVEEVASEGRMTEDTKQFLDQLDKDKQKTETHHDSPSRPQRYVSAEWWDPSLRPEYSEPQYHYLPEMDSWRPHKSTTSIIDYTSTSVSHTLTLNKPSKWRRFLNKIRGK